jgi:hypothetical protein
MRIASAAHCGRCCRKIDDEQRERARRAQKKEEISVEGEPGVEPTKFLDTIFETEASLRPFCQVKKDEVNVARSAVLCRDGRAGGDR